MKILASLSIACAGFLYVAVAWNGGFMTGFGARSDSLNSYSAKQLLINSFILIATFLLIYTLWRPNRILIVGGGILLSPIVIIGLLCLTAPPLGIVILLLPYFWYCVAYSHWKESKIIEEVNQPLQNLRTLRESENEEKKSNKTEMAMPRKPSD